MNLDNQKSKFVTWINNLRDQIVDEFLLIEQNFSGSIPNVKRKKWQRSDKTFADGGGGESTVIYGQVFEKVGVNISVVYGRFSEEFIGEVSGATESNGEFWASGISLVSHMQSPFIPAVHMNTRFICTSKSWFGGGIDLTPIYYNENDDKFFHAQLRAMCDKFDKNYYEKFKKNCDDYFFIKHRNEPRGIGGIFYDGLNSGNWEHDYEFNKAVGKAFLDIYPSIVRANIDRKWTQEEREYQLLKRGRYVEFNLLYDRGTRFGLKTGGNPDAIMMSMPPEVKWA